MAAEEKLRAAEEAQAVLQQQLEQAGELGQVWGGGKVVFYGL